MTIDVRGFPAPGRLITISLKSTGRFSTNLKGRPATFHGILSLLVIRMRLPRCRGGGGTGSYGTFGACSHAFAKKIYNFISMRREPETFLSLNDSNLYLNLVLSYSL